MGTVIPLFVGEITMAIDPVTDQQYTPLSQQAYDTLLREISDGTLRPGTSLNRAAVAKRLGMSPIPVLEALRLLERDGLVECPPKWTARVRVQDIAYIQDDYVLREALESQAARLAAEKATDEELSELVDMGRQVDESMRGPDEGAAEAWNVHLGFHMKVAELSGCDELERQLRLVNLRLIMHRNWKAMPPSFVAERDWHLEFARAIATRDVSVADSEARIHVQMVKEADMAELKMTGQGEAP